MRRRTVLLALACFAAGFGAATWMHAERSSTPTCAPPSSTRFDRPRVEPPPLEPTLRNAAEVVAMTPPLRRVDASIRRRVARTAPSVESAPAAVTYVNDFDVEVATPPMIGDPITLGTIEPSRPLKVVRARFLMAGRPVAGVEINGARSDAEGRIAFTLPRNYRGFLVVTQPDGPVLNITPAQDDAESYDFGDVRIQPAGTIRGVVVDEDGRAVPLADVALLSSDLDCRTLGATKTDAEGRFSIGGVGPYRYEVYIRTNATTGARSVAVAAGAELRVVVKPMIEVVLELVTDETGAPLPGPWTSCELRRPGAAYDASFHELRHEGAEVRLQLDTPGWYEIDVRHGDHDPNGWRRGGVAAVEVFAGRENVVEVRLRRPSSGE